MLTVAIPTRSLTRAAVPCAARAAAGAGADLLLLPSLPGEGRQPCDGPLAEHIGHCAGSEGIAILFTYAEACSGNTHLALQLVQADGRATANCRAAHLPEAALEDGLSPGNWLTMARFKGLRMGLMAGLDPIVPEVGRALSSLGAEVLIGAMTPSPAHPGLDARALASVRALENGVPVLLVSEDGMRAAATADGCPADPIRAGDLDIFQVAAGDRHGAVSRRPELYRQLQMAMEPALG